MIEIVPYDPRWPKEFAELAARIRAAVQELALRIDHIGSTSVPGLDAKDILDLMITVRDFEQHDELVQALLPLGFKPKPEYTRDHPRAGWSLSPQQWEKRYLNRRTPHRPANLHVRAAGRANQRYALLFRDYLRVAPDAAAGYAALKRQLAHYLGLSGDIDTYVDIKDPVCDIIMTGADAWAAETGWVPGPPDA